MATYQVLRGYMAVFHEFVARVMTVSPRDA